MENNELCEVGSILWQDVLNERDASYKKYVDHIKSCAECKRKLEIDDVIMEDELREVLL